MDNWQLVAQELGFSNNLKFEWSLKIKNGQLSVRPKVLCWIRNKQGRSIKELEIAKAKLVPKKLSDFINTPDIVNLGLTLGHDDNTVYIHSRTNSCATNKEIDTYTGYSKTGRKTYEFHYFPFTADCEYPEDFICEQHKSLFKVISRSEEVRQLSGFWLRRNKGLIDQVSIGLLHTPNIASLQDKFPDFSFPKLNCLDLNEYRCDYIKYLAFNRDNSLTLYFSGAIAPFPPDFETMRKRVRLSGKKTHSSASKLLTSLASPSQNKTSDIGEFYNTKNIELWKNLLGPNMYYHFALFEPSAKTPSTWDEKPFHKAVVDLCRHISDGSKVYDMGCGYGGVSSYLQNSKGCEVVAATISKTQFQYVASLGIRARCADMETTCPPGIFDVILMFESFEHVMNKKSLIERIKKFTKKIVIRTSTCTDNRNNRVFANTMNLLPGEQIKQMLETAGYKISHYANRRPATLKTFEVWQERMQHIHIPDDEHYLEFKKFVDHACEDIQIWGEHNQLIDIVAEVCAN